MDVSGIRDSPLENMGSPSKTGRALLRMCADGTETTAVTVGLENIAALQDDDAALSPTFTTLDFGGVLEPEGILAP